MEKKKVLRFIVLMATAILLFTTYSLSQCLPYLGQTPPGNIPVRLVPDSLAANKDWQYHGTPSFSPDGTEMYYAIYRYNPGRVEIWFTECVNGKWNSPKKAPFSNNSYDNNNPYFSRHNDTLYFFSGRSNGFIYRVTRTNGVWSSPVALNLRIPAGYSYGFQFSMADNGNLYSELSKNGQEDIFLWRFVNGQYQSPEKLTRICSAELDFTPFIDPEERFIIFSSRRPGGFGNTDMYISKRNPDDTWSSPVNLGKAINSGDAISPIISRDGKYFFFDAWVPGALGGNPYWVNANVVTDMIQDTTVTDVDGNIYKTVIIGDQTWMAENLRSTHYSDGTSITCFDYNNDSSNSQNFGRLYPWPAIIQDTSPNNGSPKYVQGIAPDGWHLATKEEWETLFNSLGGAPIAGGKLKESGTTHWNSPNTGATNSSGFTAVAGGFRGSDGIYYDLGKHGSYWGITNTHEPFCVYLYHNSIKVISEVSPEEDKTSGICFAVRCVKNAPNSNVKIEHSNPGEFSLFQNYPNPFNPATTIRYNLKTQSYVKLTITNILGAIVLTLADEMQNAGMYEYRFNAVHLSSGIYFYQLKTRNYQEIKRMVLLR